MSAAQRVTSPSFGPAATTRVAAGRNVAPTSFSQIEEISGSNPMQAEDQSVRYDESFEQQSGHRRQQQQSPQRREGFTDFSSYAAVSYIDEVIAQNQEWGFKQMVFPSEFMHGVGQYETNMRVIAGVDQVAGESFDRVF